jgi:hypothetical protein
VPVNPHGPWPYPPLADRLRVPTSRARIIERQYAHIRTRVDAVGIDGPKASVATGLNDAVGKKHV